jgi:hypothetical protein
MLKKLLRVFTSYQNVCNISIHALHRVQQQQHIGGFQMDNYPAGAYQEMIRCERLEDAAEKAVFELTAQHAESITASIKSLDDETVSDVAEYFDSDFAEKMIRLHIGGDSQKLHEAIHKELANTILFIAELRAEREFESNPYELFDDVPF